MRKSLVVCALAAAWVAAAGCSSAPPSSEPTATTSSPIQGGTDDGSTHPFAVGIAIDLGGGEGAMCSGALLAPNLVATARHCVAMLASSQVDCSTSNFGGLYATSQFIVTTSPVLQQGATLYGVSKIVVPSGSNQTKVCGNDLALLILSKNVQLSQYVEPAINPSLTDHTAWATTVTAIGYGIDTPTDMNGASAGTRRIKENINLACIPNDKNFTDCFSDPTAMQYMAASEFASGDGTCEGDSGSSAYDQTQFNNGKWVSFGVLSRGSVSPDGQTCTGAIYTRFDSWAQLLVDTANQAAQMGGYTPPTWASSNPSPDGGASSGGSGSGSGGSSGDDGGSSGLSNGAACKSDTDCSSQNCVSDDGKTYICAAPCGSNGSCSSGTTCKGRDDAGDTGYCFPDPATTAKAGCSVAMSDPDPVPWRSAGIGLGLAALAVVRRRAKVAN